MHRKSRFLAITLLLLVVYMTGCGRLKDSGSAAEDYYERQSGSVNERLDNVENSDVNSIYNQTMKKFENNDFKKLEGNKRLQRFGIGLVFLTVFLVVFIVFGGGYVNSKILG